VRNSFLFLGFVAGFLDNKTEELTKRLPKDYEMVRIGVERNFKGGVSDNVILSPPQAGEES
jgi:hypothetical protein